jgi:hypothetical protein
MSKTPKATAAGFEFTSEIGLELIKRLAGEPVKAGTTTAVVARANGGFALDDAEGTTVAFGDFVVEGPGNRFTVTRHT